MSQIVYRQSPNALFTDVDDDILALNVKDGQCYGMEKVTSSVWRMLDEPMNIEQICNGLLALYDVEPEVCRTDVEKLIAQLHREGLIEVSASSTEAPAEMPAGK